MTPGSSGILIVVEGIDGVGKSTQVRLLERALIDCGEDVVCSREPTDGKWGKLVRESALTGRLSLAEELQAFIEDRKEHTEQTIRPALARGAIVVLDRYYFSTIAYQGARGADVAQLTEQMRALFHRPDIVLLIDADPQFTLDRIRHARGDIPNEFERAESLAVVRGIFHQLAKNDQQVQLLDASRPVTELHREILRLLVDGVLKQFRCAKPEGCNGVDCANAQSGTCRWYTLQRCLLTIK